MKIRVTGRGLLLSSIICASGNAMAWGEAGHMIVNRAAVQLMTSKDKPFFVANVNRLSDLAKTPDLLWKQSATAAGEKPTHFFQWDQFEKSQLSSMLPVDLNRAITAVGRPYIDQNGSAPWRAAQIYKKLRDALAAKNCGLAIQMAGVLGHYIGDLSQPMHNSSDYDGQSIKKPGIHKFFESTLVGRQNQGVLLSSVIKAGSGSSELLSVDTAGQPMDVIALAVNESKTALGDLDDLLADFQQNPEDDVDLASRLAPLMGHGAMVLAHIWDMAANSAGTSAQNLGSHCPAQAVTVADPAWFPLGSVNM